MIVSTMSLVAELYPDETHVLYRPCHAIIQCNTLPHIASMPEASGCRQPKHSIVFEEFDTTIATLYIILHIRLWQPHNLLTITHLGTLLKSDLSWSLIRVQNR